jgi:thiol-disulfide isomerase/thioredoxin
MRSSRPVMTALIAVGVLALAAPAGAGSSMSVAAPPFDLPARGGGRVSLEKLRGQVVMINFWASWCGPCRQEFPVLDSIYRKYGPMGFSLVAVNVESDSSDAERFLAALPVSFPVAYDGDNAVSGQYGVSAMPTTLIVDRKGQVRWLHRAYKPGDEDEYLNQIRSLLREAP